MSRRAARVAAVELLYAADVRGADPAGLVEQRASDGDPIAPYAEHLIREVTRRRDEIDAILAGRARNWPVERMSPVDRNLLRLGILELLEGEVPAPSVIDEAVEIAKRFSGEDAGRFVNGVLAGVLADQGSARGSPSSGGSSEDG